MKRFLIIFALVVLVALVVLLNFGYSSGIRSGRLVKLSKVGFIYKTYEGTLDLGSGDKLTWDFSIHNDDLAEQLMIQSGNHVSLKFKEHIWAPLYRTPYNVLEWELVADGVSQNGNLCRFVRLIKRRPDIVEIIRPLLLEHDRELLELIRQCK